MERAEIMMMEYNEMPWGGKDELDDGKLAEPHYAKTSEID